MSWTARAAAFAAGALALAGGAAQASQAGVSKAASRQVNVPVMQQLNPFWSGYVLTGPADAAAVAFTSVTGTWTVPTVSCGHKASSSAVWVGLGGYATQVLEQAGVNANCDARGKPVYFAWYELVPDIARDIDAKVFPGDTITSSVKILDFAVVALHVVNQTRHWSFNRQIAWGTSDTGSAEWITEAPNNCLRNVCRVASLANFGRVTFKNIGATGNGAPGTLSNPAWTAIPLRLVPGVHTALGSGFAIPSHSHAGATPGSLSTDGRTFRISWVARATRG
jgi:Peptidase A4 family